MIQYFPIVTGSLTVLGNINVSGSITTSGSITISGSITSASFATSASNATNAISASYANNLTVAGTLTAQTLVVQTITSSVDFVTGSTRFGSILGNTHVFSGSVTMNPNGLFVSSSGLVGIGNIVPAYTLDVSGTGRYTGALTGTSATFSSSVTAGTNLILTAGTLFGAGNTGFSNRSSDTTLYLQMPATGFNITDNVLNTKVIISSAGLTTFQGFGSHSFSSGGTGYNKLTIRNTTAGAANGAQLSVGTDADADQLYIQSFATTYTTSGMNVAGGAVINGEGPGGLNLAATQANIGFYTNGSATGNLRMAISSSGDVTFGTGMRISQIGSNTISALTSNLILYSTGYNVYIRPATGYEAIIDSGNGLNVTGKIYTKSGGGNINPTFTTLFTMEGFSTYIITMHTGTGDGTYGIHTAIYDSGDLATAVLSGNNISSQISGTDFQIKSNNGSTYGLTWTALRIK